MSFATALRQELRLLPASANPDGSPSWMIHDPVTNRFFRIGWLDFELLLRWGMESPSALLNSVRAETTLDPQEEDIRSLSGFLQQHELLQSNGADGTRQLHARAQAASRGVSDWLLHHYLFFRIPLVRPQDVLGRWARHLAFVFTPTMAMLVLALAVLGLVLMARQWDTFTAAVVDQISWSGALGFAAALAVSKALHELGHALTASRFGVRVAHMGVAVLVMFPMLYTDTSESWKLRKPRQRLAIASAGIVSELGLATIATVAWSLTPDGGLRNAWLFLATTGWLLTLAVNASPFMRFDGYFILCDLFDFPNLHERSGQQAKVWLRRLLLGSDIPWPEHFSPGTRRTLVVFALATWLYRLVLYLSIAVLVYAFFFKLLGIALMLVEIWWFILKPLSSEVAVLWKLRKSVRPSRRVALGACFALFIVLLSVPWRTGVGGHGWIHPERQQVIHAPLSGRLVSLPVAGSVVQGQRLVTLDSPDMQHQAQRARVTADTRARELVGLVGLAEGEQQRARVTLDRDRYEAEARLFDVQAQRLQMEAPFAGQLVDIDPHLNAGSWVNPRQPLATLIDPTSWVVDTLVAEEDLSRVAVGDPVSVWMTAGASDPMVGVVEEIDTTRTTVLPHPMLDGQWGGPIATSPATAGSTGGSARAEGSPRASLFRVRVRMKEAPQQVRVGQVQTVVHGHRRSWLMSGWAFAAAVLVRESGF